MDYITHEMAIKYHIMRYIAGEMSKLSLVGGTFYKPMFFEFPNDDGSYVASP
jgi:alpha-glucosidase (family GH31 glycosyl hydrolase)